MVLKKDLTLFDSLIRCGSKCRTKKDAIKDQALFVLWYTLKNLDLEWVIVNSKLKFLYSNFSSQWNIKPWTKFIFKSMDSELCNMQQETTTSGKERICKLVFCKSSLNIFFRILKGFSTTFLSQDNQWLYKVTRSQVPCRPTWGSKYAAMRKELELGAAP
jgi:hypothetical protein